MASSKGYFQYIMEQLSSLEEATSRAMMGEYILYYRGRIVGGIYDDRLLVKPVPSACALLPEAPMEQPYAGAKAMLLVEAVDDKAFLAALFRAMYQELPEPKGNKKQRGGIILNLELVNLPEIAVIGREGFCTEAKNVTQMLWEQFDAHFAEVAELGMRERDGSLVGFWGAMSDETISFQPWTNHFTRGYYLAGIEVSGDAQPPEGWTKWVLPPRTYLKVEVDMSRYMETFFHVLEAEIPRRKLKLCGAVCDHTKPATGRHYLLFPVEEG